MKKLLIAVLALVMALSFSLVTAVPVVAQSTWYVATTGSDTTGNGSQTNPWGTIQYAIDQASAGDTINVAPGTYLEWTGAVGAGCAVEIPFFAEGAGGLTIQSSDGAANTIIDCGWAASGVKIVSNSITLTGFTVKNAYTAVGQVSAKNHTLSNLIITDFVNVGLELMAVHDCQFSNITIHGNDVSKSNNRTVKGIDMQEYGSGGNTNNTFEDITIYDIETTGTYGSSMGIHWEGDHQDPHPTINNTLANVTIYDMVGPWIGAGIYMYGKDNSLPAIVDTTFSGGSIYNCSSIGIYVLGGCQNLSVSGFDINNNGKHGIGIRHYYGTPCGNVDINYNNFSGHTSTACYGVKNYNAENHVDATNNWWGAADGPSGMGPGSGDAVSDNVDYAPWLTGLAYTGGTLFLSTTSVVLEATLSNSTPGGASGADVSFYVDDAFVDSATTNASGVATLDIGTKPVGVYAVKARAAGCLVAEAVLTVYELAEGMATGGGWFITEDTGGIGNVTPGGKAAFGFVAKQKKETSSGQLEFQYKTDDLNLKSTSYDAVALSTTQVIFQGEGRLNGAPGYKFRVHAFDGAKAGEQPDRFSIRIWTGNDDSYTMPTHRAEGDLGGGNIVVHKK